MDCPRSIGRRGRRNEQRSAAAETELLLIGRDLIVVAIVVAAAGVVAEMACLRAALRVSRRELRGGGGTA